MHWDPAQTWLEVSRVLGPEAAATSLLLPAAVPASAPWPDWVPAPLKAHLARDGIGTLYPHQQQAAQAAWRGDDVALAAGTATGKTLAYQLPILSRQCADDPSTPTSLYLAPTKALAHDQLRKLRSFDLPGLRPAAFDGDTPSHERQWVRRHATYVVSNPDMVHTGLLPNHPAWQSFLKRLRYVVVDEFHIYRGLFGANLSAVLRRLLRVAEHYGSAPVVVGASATVADPASTLSTLTGRPAVAVQPDATGRSDIHLRLLAPAEDGLLHRTAALLAALVSREVSTLAFVRSRRAAEVVAQLSAQRLADCGMADRVASYRGGYLPEERRDLERGLGERRYLGLAATSALELGIDISGLDAVLVAGWPGTRAALRQRLGRAGRSGRPALAVFLADSNPLDAHLVRHPQQVVSQSEGLVVDTANPYVLAPHLCAAAAELPLTDDEAQHVFGRAAADLLPELGRRGLLRRRPQGWFWTRSDRAADLADLRGIAGAAVSVVEQGTGRLIGSVDASAADRTLHPGAVYTHQGRDHLVSDLDQERSVAVAAVASVAYSTHAQSIGDTRLLQVVRSESWGRVAVHYGLVEASAQVVGYLKRRITTGEVIGQEPLELPTRWLRTKAVWWTIPEDVIAEAGIPAGSLAGAAHAAEHAAIGMLPLFAHCDRWDVGGLSTTCHPDTGMCTIVVRDGLPGGAGYAERGFAVARQWLHGTLDAVQQCPCETGCPSCVQSPKCGNGNEPLDKGAAVTLLGAMLCESGPP